MNVNLLLSNPILSDGFPVCTLKCGVTSEAYRVLAAGQAVSVCGAIVKPEESQSHQAGIRTQKLRS
jgi:hypothetical protein